MQLNFVLDLLRHVPSFFVAKFEKLISRICYRWQKKNSKKWFRQTTLSKKLYFSNAVLKLFVASWVVRFSYVPIESFVRKPFAFPTHPLTKTSVAFETSGKYVHTMHTKCLSLLLRNHLYLRKWSAPSCVYWRHTSLFLNLHRCMRNYRRYHLFFWWTGISFFLFCFWLYCSHLNIVHKK